MFAYRSTQKSTTSGQYPVYDMNATLYDWVPADMHSDSVNNTRLVAPDPGKYTVYYQVRWSTGGGARVILINKNSTGTDTSGTRIHAQNGDATGGGLPTIRTGSFPAFLNAGDWIEMFTHQASGGPLDVDAGSAATYLAMDWVSKQ